MAAYGLGVPYKNAHLVIWRFSMSKRQLNVKIDSDLYENASKKINDADLSMAFVVETLLSLFVSDQISIQKKDSYRYKGE